jgi:hypothetical protein
MAMTLAAYGRVRGCDLFEFDAGRIAKKDSYWKIVE